MEDELTIKIPDWFGLMFEFRKNVILEIELESDTKLHTYFCRTLDMWFYNSDEKLISTKYNIKPFSIVELPKNTKYVIEMTI